MIKLTDKQLEAFKTMRDQACAGRIGYWRIYQKISDSFHIGSTQTALLSMTLATLLLTLPEMAAAGQCYRFGRDFNDNNFALNKAPVCKALLQNFNEYCDEPPMVCELRIHPKFSKLLSRPNWKRISPTPSIEDIERFITAPEDAAEGVSETMWAFWRPKIESALQHGTLTMDEADVDLLNRGQKERVLRVQTGECTSENQATPDSDHSLMYQTDGIYTNFAPEVYPQHPKRGFSGGGGVFFMFNGKTYDYGMRLDTIVVNQANDSTNRIIGNHKGACLIQMNLKEKK